MDCVALWDSDDDHERIQRRILRDNSNIMNLSESNFVKNFRLSKDAFMYVLSSIENEFAQQRSTAIPTIVKLSTALSFLSQGGYQHQIGKDRNLSLAQQSVSSCIWAVCKAIEKILCPKHIVFEMSEQEKRRANRHFFTKCSIPGVIGVIDGTHIQMIRPSRNEHLYFNRKLKHIMNAMVICDDQMIIRAVDGRFGGACHDSHVWNLSDERKYLVDNFERGERGTVILGDSGYPLEPWLLTPYRNAAESSAEARFNEKLSKARSIIERVFGVLKGRFRCTLAARELHYAPEKVVTIFNVCCALHNICILYNVEPPTEISSENGENVASNVINEENGNITNIARALREEIKNSMFANM